MTSFIVKRPWVSLVVVAALLALMTNMFADVREPSEGEVAVWSVAVPLVLLATGLILAFSFPRLARDRTVVSRAQDNALAVVYVQWAAAVAAYVFPLFAWFLFATPTWVLLLAAATVAVGLVVLIVINRSHYQRLIESLS